MKTTLKINTKNDLFKMKKTFTHLLFFCFCLFLLGSTYGEEKERERISVAKFTGDGSLIRPENIDEWIFLGASVGHGYPPKARAGKFSLSNPGQIQIVQMEPFAYKYFKSHGHYADGTMLSLSFYNISKDPVPAVDGMVQGDLETFEIHLLDKERFNDKRAFYLYSGNEVEASMIREGNDCVVCHDNEAHFDGTFSDFYPVIRDEILKGRR